MMEYGTVKNYFEIPIEKQGILSVRKLRIMSHFHATELCLYVFILNFMFFVCFEFPTVEVPCLKFKKAAISK